MARNQQSPQGSASGRDFGAELDAEFGVPTETPWKDSESFKRYIDAEFGRYSAGPIERHARQLGAGIVEFAAPVMQYTEVAADVLGLPEWVKQVPLAMPGGSIAASAQLGREASAAAEQIAPPEMMTGSWTEKAARAAPSVPKYLAASALGGPVGVAGLGAVENAVSSYERTLELTGDPKKAKVAFAFGHLVGALESIGGVGGKEVTGGLIKRIIFGGKDEFLQEALSAGLNAKMIELISGMDLNVAREMWDEGTIGAVFGGAAHALGGGRATETEEEEEETDLSGGDPGVPEQEDVDPEREATPEDRAWAMRFLEQHGGRRQGTTLGQEEGGEKTERDEMLEALENTAEAEASMGKEIVEPPRKVTIWPSGVKKSLAEADPTFQNLPRRASEQLRNEPGHASRVLDELKGSIDQIGKEHKVPQSEIDQANEEVESIRRGAAKRATPQGMLPAREGEKMMNDALRAHNEALRRWGEQGLIPAPIQQEVPPTPIETTEEVEEILPPTWDPKEKLSLKQVDPNFIEPPAVDKGKGVRAYTDRLDELVEDYFPDVPSRVHRDAKRILIEEMNAAKNQGAHSSEVHERLAERFNRIVKGWVNAGYLPKPTFRRKSTKTRPSRQRYRDALDTVGRAVGASDTDIQAAQEALNAAPDEIGIEDEYVRIANILRERASGQAPIGAPFPPRRMGAEEPDLPDTTTKGSYIAPDLTLRGKQAIGRKKYGGAPSPAPSGKTAGPRPAVYTPRRRELDLRPEDVAAEEQLKGQAEIAGGAVLQAHKAEIEPKTGLLNEAGFKRNLKEIAEKAKRLKQRMVVIYVDLRDLTGLNELFGHQTADEIIGHDFGPDDRKGFVGRWADVARQADARGARTGLGDEFESAGVVSAKGDPMVIVERLEALADAELEEQGLEGKVAGRKFGADAGWAEVDLTNPDLDAAIQEARERADQMSKKRKAKANPRKKKLSKEQFAKLAPKAQRERARRLAARGKAQGGAQEPTAQMATAQPGGRGATGMAPTKPKAPPAEPEALHAGGLSTKGLMTSAKESKKALKNWLQAQLVSRGHKPREARRIVEEAEGEIAAADRYVRITKRALEVARKKSKTSLEEVRDALEDPAKLAALPEPVRTAAADARGAIDRLSRLLVSKGLVSGKLAETILKGEGRYLHRAYRAHHDADWAKKVPAEVRERLHSLLMSYAQPLSKADRTALLKRARKGDREARFEANMRRAFKGMSGQQVTDWMNEMLQEAREHAMNPWTHLSKGKLGRKDMSLFMKRKGLPVELREFLGEEKNPLTNYADSMLRMSTFLARHRQFLRLASAGLQNGWLHKAPTGPYISKISSEQNKSLAPLNGLYTTEEIKMALLETAPTKPSNLEKTLRVVGAMWKRGKTIYNIPIGPLKQVAQNVELFMTVGNVTHFPKALIAAWKSKGKSLDPKVQRYIELNLIQTGLVQAEMDELYRAFKHERGAGATLREFERHLGETYAVGDNAARIAFFEHKKKVLEKAGYAEDEAERIAADQALDAVPTPSRLPELAKRLRPYSGFISYTVERVRTIANLIEISVGELKSGNPVLQKNGAITLARMAAMGYGFRALRQWINSLNGIDDEEEADMDRLSPYWARGKTPVRFGDSKSGRFFDLSQFDHLAWLSEPIAALLAKDPKRALDALHDELIEPFITVPFLETLTGKTAPQIVSEMAGFEKPKREQSTIRERSMKELVPGIPGVGWAFPMKDFIQRLSEMPGDIAPAFLGARSYKYEPMVALTSNARYAQGQFVGVSEKTNEKLGDLSYEALNGATQYADKERAAIFEELHEDVRAALRLGFERHEIYQALLAGGISKENAQAILVGNFRSARKLVGEKARERRREEARSR